MPTEFSNGIIKTNHHLLARSAQTVSAKPYHEFESHEVLAPLAVRHMRHLNSGEQVPDIGKRTHPTKELAAALVVPLGRRRYPLIT
jgi:hypothetical protein